jgi:hypothetical protein
MTLNEPEAAVELELSDWPESTHCRHPVAQLSSKPTGGFFLVAAKETRDISWD